MWKYNYSDDQKDYLMHVNGFKYIAKVPFKKGFRYFYTKDDYNAYLNSNKVLEQMPAVTPQPIAKITLTEKVHNFLDAKKAPESTNIQGNLLDKGKSILKDLSDAVDKKREELEAERQKKREEEARKQAEEERKKQEEEAQNKSDEADRQSVMNEIFNTLYDKKSDPDETSDEDREEVNPSYSLGLYEYTNNCAYCTATWDMRRRGYDVEANPVSEITINTTEEICSWYDPAPSLVSSDKYADTIERDEEGYINNLRQVEKDITKDILAQGDGARGTFLLSWVGGSGHSVGYEVRGNKVVLVDSQTNQTIKMSEYLQYAESFEYFRMDNLTPNRKITKTCTNKKDVSDIWKYYADYL